MRKKLIPSYYAKNIAQNTQRRFLKRKAQEKAEKEAAERTKAEKASPKLV